MKKLWTGFAGLILAVGLLLAFRQDIYIRLLPRLALSGALEDAVSSLEGRFAGHPLLSAYNYFASGDCYEAQVQLDQDRIRYEMKASYQASPRRVQVRGIASASGMALDLAVYLDGDFAGITSQALLQGDFYGIAYNALSEDGQEAGLLSMLLGEESADEVRGAVTSLKEDMNRAPTTLPKISWENLRTLPKAVLAMDFQVEAEKMELDGRKRTVYHLTGRISGSDLARSTKGRSDRLPETVSALIDRMSEDPESEIVCEFWLWGEELVKLTCSVTLEGECFLLEGDSPGGMASGDLALSILSQGAETTERGRVMIHSVFSDTYRQDRVELRFGSGEAARGETLYLNWVPDAGALILRAGEGADESACLLKLEQASEGVFLYTEHLGKCLNRLMGEQSAFRDSLGKCVIRISRASQVSVPEYRDLASCSMEMLLSLMGSLGALFGLPGI